MNLPDWNVITQAWPLIGAVAILWARLEVTLAKLRQQTIQNESRINAASDEAQRRHERIHERITDNEKTTAEQVKSLQDQATHQATQLAKIAAGVEHLVKSVDRILDRSESKDRSD